jgi:hypothetical protein
MNSEGLLGIVSAYHEEFQIARGLLDVLYPGIANLALAGARSF